MKKFFIVLPTIVLMLIAVRHNYLVRTTHITPWKGGGFGMFSKVFERFFKVHLLINGEKIPVKLPERKLEEVHTVISKLRRYPNQADLQVVANAIKELSWVESVDEASEIEGLPKLLRPTYFNENPKNPFQVDSVEVEIWEVDMRIKQKALISKRLVKAISKGTVDNFVF